jgi:hypothetical protein
VRDTQGIGLVRRGPLASGPDRWNLDPVVGRRSRPRPDRASTPDNCRGPDSEGLEPWAADIVDRLGSYTEISPSGTGVHVPVEGTLPAGRNRRGAVEMDGCDRGSTVTGAHLAGSSADVTRRQSALLAVHYESSGLPATTRHPDCPR